LISHLMRSPAGSPRRTTGSCERGSMSAEESAAAPTGTHLSRRKTVVGVIITLAVLAVVFLGIIPKIGSYSEAWQAIRAIPVVWLVLLVASVVAMIVVYVWPYPAAIPGLRFGPAFVVRQTSFTFSNAVPAGGAVGLAVQYMMLGTYRVSPAAATAGIAVTSVWSIFITLGLPIMGVLAMLVVGQMDRSFLTAGLVGLAAIVGSLIVFWLILRSESSARRVAGVVQRMVAPLARRLHRQVDITASVLHFREQVVDVVRDRWQWITATNVLVAFAQYLVLFIAIKSVGGESAAQFSFLAGFGAMAISRLASMIPATPGGLGTVDAALIGLLIAFGLDKDIAVAADLVWRAASFVPQVCVGVGTFVWWRARQQRLGSV